MSKSAEVKCRKPGCINPIHYPQDRFCDECLTPNIEQEVKEFLDLRKQGYSRSDAEIAVGWSISVSSPLGA